MAVLVADAPFVVRIRAVASGPAPFDPAAAIILIHQDPSPSRARLLHVTHFTVHAKELICGVVMCPVQPWAVDNGMTPIRMARSHARMSVL